MSMENYESVLADLQTRRDQIDAAIEAIRLIMGAGAESVNGSGSSSQRAISPQDVPAGAFHRLSLVDATKKYLDMVKSKQGTMQILKALEQGGMPPTKYQTLYAVLRRRQSQIGDLVKMGDEWGLTEWYPNNPNLKKKAEGKSIPKKKKRKKAKTVRKAAVDIMQSQPEAQASLSVSAETVNTELTITDAAEKVLIKAGKALHANEIRSGMVELGKTTSRDAIARALPLDKKGRFVRTGANIFDLAARTA